MYCIDWLTVVSVVSVVAGTVNSSPAEAAVGTEGENGVCVLELNPVYAITSSTVSFYLPCLAMLCIYYRLYRYARKQVETIRMTYKTSLGGGTRSSHQAVLGVTAGDDEQDGPASSPLRDKVSDHKAAITLGIIMGVFLMSWSPFCLRTIHACGRIRRADDAGGLTKSRWPPAKQNPRRWSGSWCWSVVVSVLHGEPGRRSVWSRAHTHCVWSVVVGALCGPGCVPPLVFAVFTWLGYVNSTMNPITYHAYYGPNSSIWCGSAVRLVVQQIEEVESEPDHLQHLQPGVPPRVRPCARRRPSATVVRTARRRVGLRPPPGQVRRRADPAHVRQCRRPRRIPRHHGGRAAKLAAPHHVSDFDERLIRRRS